VRLLIVADAFPPMRTSAAVHMHELTIELSKLGHLITVVTPSAFIKKGWIITEHDEYRLASVRTPRTKDVSYLRRTIAEFISPYFLYAGLKSTPIIDETFDGIIWYSPTIFFGPLISRLKKRFSCPAYLILRDMFPDWAVDLGLMKKALPYYFLKIIEFYQYKVADHIGIQSPGNFKYFNNGFLRRFRPKIELLWTWVTPSKLPAPCSITLQETCLAGRVIFVYAGNMGVAQDFNLLMNMVKLYEDKVDVGFVFVGRGSEVQRLKKEATQFALTNIIFFDEINSSEIPALYAQCDIGLVALDPRHKSNNIPGKFLSYMESGLPVLARLNTGNDLIQLISENQVGASYVGFNPHELQAVADQLMRALESDQSISIRCKQLANSLFSTEKAVKQIIDALKKSD